MAVERFKLIGCSRVSGRGRGGLVGSAVPPTKRWVVGGTKRLLRYRDMEEGAKKTRWPSRLVTKVPDMVRSPHVARILRIKFPGATYHVINADYARGAVAALLFDPRATRHLHIPASHPQRVLTGDGFLHLGHERLEALWV